MTVHARLKNFTEGEKYHNLMTWLTFLILNILLLGITSVLNFLVSNPTEK